jgi:hypothetical protein
VQWISPLPSKGDRVQLWQEFLPAFKEDSNIRARLLQRQIFSVVRNRTAELSDHSSNNYLSELPKDMGDSYMERFKLPIWRDVLIEVHKAVGTHLQGPLVNFNTQDLAAIPLQQEPTLIQAIQDTISRLPQVTHNPALRTAEALETLMDKISPIVLSWAKRECGEGSSTPLALPNTEKLVTPLPPPNAEKPVTPPPPPNAEKLVTPPPPPNTEKLVTPPPPPNTEKLVVSQYNEPGKAAPVSNPSDSNSLHGIPPSPPLQVRLASRKYEGYNSVLEEPITSPKGAEKKTEARLFSVLGTAADVAEMTKAHRKRHSARSTSNNSRPLVSPRPRKESPNTTQAPLARPSKKAIEVPLDRPRKEARNAPGSRIPLKKPLWMNGPVAR